MYSFPATVTVLIKESFLAFLAATMIVTHVVINVNIAPVSVAISNVANPDVLINLSYL
jgi:predicted signal transduction protein with EAL and GGDEF domain